MSTLTRHVPAATRYTLGGAFFVFGLNGFLGFIPQPPPPAEAAAFLGGLAASGYMFPLIKGTEVIAGALLLANRHTTLALALLAPVLVNIVAFHAFLAPAGIALPLVLLTAALYLTWTYRAAYMPMLRARIELDAPGSSRSIDVARTHVPA